MRRSALKPDLAVRSLSLVIMGLRWENIWVSVFRLARVEAPCGDFCDIHAALRIIEEVCETKARARSL